MRGRLKTSGIVLKRHELLNKDIVYTLLTQDLGKVRVIAKGVKSLTSKRSPHLQTGNLIDTVLYKKSEYYYLQETQLRSGFSEIKNNSAKMSYLYFILFVLDRLVPEEQTDEKVYQLLMKFMINLSKAEKPNIKLLEEYLSLFMIDLGYISQRKNIEELHAIIQDLINEKLKLHIL